MSKLCAWSCLRSATGAALCCSLLLQLLLQTNAQAASANWLNSPRLELKFQAELDNSTIFKQEGALQILKCQVRLALIAAGAQTNKRLRSSQTPLERAQQQVERSPVRWPQDVELAIDWLKDERLVGAPGSEQVNVVSGELRQAANASAKTNDKSGARRREKQWRLEIKNTLNGSQLKLTSRLRVGQLRAADSGQYKCVARANFTSPQAQLATAGAANEIPQTNLIDVGSAGGPQQQKQQQQQRIQLVRNEQTLESNGAYLLVLQPSSTNSELAANDKGSEWKFAARQPTLGAHNNNRKASPASGRQQQSNDTRHAIEAPQKGELGGDATQLAAESEGNQQAQRRRAEMSRLDNNRYGALTPDRKSAAQSGSSPLTALYSSTNNAAPTTTNGQASSNNQFEDDEDLFRLTADRIEFISGQGLDLQPSNDPTDGLYEGAALEQPLVSKQSAASVSLVHSKAADYLARADKNASSPSASSNNSTLYESAGSPLANGRNPLVVGQTHPFHETGGETNLNDNTDGLAASGATASSDYDDDNFIASSNNNNNNNNNWSWSNPEQEHSQHQSTNTLINSSRTKLVRLVHRTITLPELSCYTGIGDHYRGNASTSLDGRRCLSWSQVRRLASAGRTNDGAISLSAPDQSERDHDNHNHCRNPNLDRRGPWCFVLYDEKLDGAAHELSNYIILSSLRAILKGNNKASVGFSPVTTNTWAKSRVVVQRHCSISSCSEYLWFYVVAPPAGLLVLLSCLIIALIRSIRRSHYKTLLFSSSSKPNEICKRKTTLMPKHLNKFLKTGGTVGVVNGKFATRKFSKTNKKGRGNYLNDDVFEIVDDIDWSDGCGASGAPQQTNSLSPKSTTTESLKLNLSSLAGSSSGSHTQDGAVSTTTTTEESHLNTSKIINPIFDRVNGRVLDGSKDLLCNRSSSPPPQMFSRAAVTQVGPMFATLRCQMRSKANQLATNSRKHLEGVNKSHEFSLNKSQVVVGNNNGAAMNDWFSTSAGSPTSMNTPLPISNSNQSSVSSSPSTGASSSAGRLISCSTTTESLDSNTGDKFIRGKDLPQLDSTRISVALNEELLYEGKFSQVQIAYMQQQSQTDSSRQPKSKDEELIASSLAHFMGSRTAIFSLKTSASINPKYFEPNEIRLRNLNHLNLIKLIGYIIQPTTSLDKCTTDAGNEVEFNEKKDTALKQCSLIFDMSHLVDLSDWLKQQCKDSVVSNELGDDLGIKRNLTCLAKQIALAVDYLHDRGIIYKDLACRNCFLDPTKLLVKLASFNVELLIPTSTNQQQNENEGYSHHDEKAQNLRSMIRPKYLLDYYVIDSRPIECQLLPLSWIPLESILFNKFNKQTDIWSFGCLIYELFSLGEVAYFGYSSKQVIDAVRSNLLPPQPLLCPNGIYKLMCKCLSDIPTLRPNVKQIYEQLNLYSGQCSSFLDHHLCLLSNINFREHVDQHSDNETHLVAVQNSSSAATFVNSVINGSGRNSITKTKSYANIKNYSPSSCSSNKIATYDNLVIPSALDSERQTRPEHTKIPLSKSINLAGNRSLVSNFKKQGLSSFELDPDIGTNHYDEPVVGVQKLKMI